jgi:DNA-binding GntR family transcriptional regulator
LEQADLLKSQEKPPLRDRAYALIKNDIITCELTPGSEVTETEMAARYGLGKAPVRAGLSRLFQDGLVLPLPRRGYLVSPITLKDIHDCMEVRMLLEPAAARQSSGRLDTKVLKQLHKDIKVNVDRVKTASYEINRRFHISIAEATNNQRLARMISDLINQLERVSRLLMKSRAASVMRSEYTAEQADHEAILKAIEAGDGDGAEQAMRQHLKTTRLMIMDSMMQNNSAEFRVDGI